ncbi:MAG TPA: polyprenyl synthetase family protein [Myxococcaceae bacterium]|nr:polyprenyl synthetase family protein [Myxococcaceae bacterium]
MDDMIIGAETTAFMTQVEETLKAALADAAGDQPRGDMLMTAARHLSIGGGGKRIRPLLVHYFGRALGVADARMVEAGAAAELIHSASLLHDDVVDNGMFRRGRPTVNSLWGNVVAVMTGDMVLTIALQRLAAVHPMLMADALGCVADMTRGTIAELEGRGDLDMPLERMRFIAEAKTGALFGWCGLAAATLADDAEARPRLGQFGRRLGVAFQIADDVRDLTAGDKGKPPFADLASKTPSLPLLLAARKDPAVRKRIQDAWAFGSMTHERLRELGAAVLATGALEEAVQRMKEEISAALELFQPYVETPGGAELVGWAHQLADAFEQRGAHEGHPVDRRTAASEQHAI